jgi:hypothetical protein
MSDLSAALKLKQVLQNLTSIIFKLNKLCTKLHTYRDTSNHSSLVNQISIVMRFFDPDFNLCCVPVCIYMVHGCTWRLWSERSPWGHRTVASVSARGRGGLVSQGTGR